jgi:hypothetical protein
MEAVCLFLSNLLQKCLRFSRPMSSGRGGSSTFITEPNQTQLLYMETILQDSLHIVQREEVPICFWREQRL